MRCRLIPYLLLALLVAVTGNRLSAADWPQWRGPEGNGVSRDEGLPVAWSEGAGLDWKCKLPEWGCSTPAIWGEAIFLTSHVDNQRLLLLRINKKTGKIEWTREVGTGSVDPLPPGGLSKNAEQRRHQQFHSDHNLASPSPVTDGQVVVVHFGNGDLAAYDLDGNQTWKRNLQKEHGDYTIWWGHANSPVLVGNMVISVCIQDSCRDLPGEPAPSYVVAHDKRTGREKWKKMRMTDAKAEECDSYVTPIVRKTGEKTEVVVMGGQLLDAYDPLTGQQLWKLSHLVGNRTITGPVLGDGIIFMTQGMRRALLAVKPSGPGELARDDILWKFDQGTPDSPTPIVAGELLMTVNNDGIARCFNAHSGKLQWKERLKGEYRASPVAGEGRVYFLNTTGLCTVVSASSRFNRLTENHLDDITLASPAIADGKLFVRGKKTLYCISK